MKLALKTLAFALLVSSCMMLSATPVTVGNYDSGNCYPFMCNDTGSDVGVSIDYQQAYSSSAFSGPIDISTISWYFASQFGGAGAILGGNYSFYWGYSAVGLGLSDNLASNYNGAATFLGTASVPSGGFVYGPILTLSGVSFTYDPSQGDLILEIVVDSQDNLPNGSDNGYNEADYTGSATTRAYCLTNNGCVGDALGALVTTFNQGSATPEPGTLVMFGSGILGLAGMLRRKINL